MKGPQSASGFRRGQLERLAKLHILVLPPHCALTLHFCGVTFWGIEGLVHPRSTTDGFGSNGF
jgi:hypothetical protein